MDPLYVSTLLVLNTEVLLAIQLLPVGHTVAQRFRAREVLVVPLYTNGNFVVDPSPIQEGQ